MEASSTESNLSTSTFNVFIIDFDNPKSGKLISDEATNILNLVVNCSVCLVICFLGILVNVVNLSVFIKQGFGETINVSFASLAIADLLSLLFLLWRDILYIPEMEDSALPVDPIAFMYLTGGWTHVYFVRVSSWITAFITFERCLCIAMPLKVKTLITPRRVTVIHVAIYLLILATVAPIFYTSRLVWKFYPEKNRSLIGLTYSEDRYEVESVVLPINGNAIPVGSLVINIICTVILVIKLNYHSKWRQDQASGGGSNKKDQGISVKEARIIKMAATISTIYVICVLPHFLIVSWMTADPEFRVEGELKNSFIISASFAFLFEAFNSSVNIFVYFNMSTKFRSTMLEMFKLQRFKGKE